jgi:hypothetical protein
MGSSSVKRVGAIVGVGLWLAACGGSNKKNPTEGEPEATNCEASTKRCDGQSILACNEEGTAESVERKCATGLFCRAEDGDATCSSLACAPNTAVCDDNVATTCKSDGLGFKPGGTDCAGIGQVCMSGKCQTFTCEAGTRVCRNGDVYTCGDDGNSISLFADCGTAEVCDAESGACEFKSCEPGKSVCNKTVAETCNASGSGYLPGSVDCAKNKMMCIAGSCSNQICEPLQRSCQDNTIFQCDFNGTKLTELQTCSADEHCELTSGGTYAECRTSCEPGAKICDQNVVKTCTEDLNYSEQGEDCGSDAWCEDGECQPRSCDVDRLFCQGSDVYFCESTRAPSLAEQCGNDRVCKDLGADVDAFLYNAALCLPRACVAGKPACFQNKVGTCASDGESLSQVTTDCSATDDVCTIDQKCAATATDTLGFDEATEGLYAGNFVGNVVDVHSARKLTELQMSIAFSSPRELRWVVFEQSGSSFVAKVDKVVTIASSAGFVSSGVNSFNFQLEAGKRYAFGVVPSIDAYSAYDVAPFAGGVSFGTVLGRAYASYSSTIYVAETFMSEQLSYMKLMTALP